MTPLALLLKMRKSSVLGILYPIQTSGLAQALKIKYKTTQLVKEYFGNIHVLSPSYPQPYPEEIR